MARTIHRNPTSVPTGSSNFTRRNYLNQNSWSGLNTDRNVATIDPQSFNASKNMFLDSNLVLCSRPAFKKNGMFEDEVVRFWEIGLTEVLEYLVDGRVVAKEYKDGKLELIYLDEEQETFEEIMVGPDISVITVEGRTYIFGAYQESNPDISNCWVYENKHFVSITWDNIQDYIYIPEVEVYTDGNPAKFETKNMATGAVAYTHIRGVSSFLDEEELNGEIVYFEDEKGNETSTVWVDGVTSRMLLDYFTPRKFNYIYMAKNGSGAIGIDSNQLFYTTNGKAWTQLTMPENRIGEPKITEDGTTALILLPSGLYALTLIAGGMDGEAEFPSWTLLCKPFVRQLGDDTKHQELEYLRGNSRSFTKLLGLEAISYDNYVFVAQGDDGLVNVYATHSSFAKLSEASGTETLYTKMWKSGTSKNVEFNNRGTTSNSYVRMPICRTLLDVNTEQTLDVWGNTQLVVKIDLKQFVYNDGEIFALLFKYKNLNVCNNLGLPSGNTYYDNNAKHIPLNIVDPEDALEADVSKTDYLRYCVFIISPGERDSQNKPQAKNHKLLAVGDPKYIGGTTEGTNNNLYQREARSHRLTVYGNTLPSDSQPSHDWGSYGVMGTSLPIEHVGFEFMENKQEMGIKQYELRFFFPVTSFNPSAFKDKDTSNSLGISFGLIDISVRIESNTAGRTLQNTFPSRPNLWRAGEVNPGTYEPGDYIFCGKNPKYTSMRYRITPSEDTTMNIGVGAKFYTEGKDKNQTEYKGVALAKNSSRTLLQLDKSEAPKKPNQNNPCFDIRQGNDEEYNSCILKISGDKVSDDPTFTDADIINLINQAVKKRMEITNYLDYMSDESVIYKEVDTNAAAFTTDYFQPVEGQQAYYLQTFSKDKKDNSNNPYYPLNLQDVWSNPVPNRVIEIPYDSTGIPCGTFDGREVRDHGGYKLECWFTWEGDYVQVLPFSNLPDGNWNIIEEKDFTYYGSILYPEFREYKNSFGSYVEDVPYHISEKDLDRSVLAADFILVPQPANKIALYPTVTKNIIDIQTFGSLSFCKNIEGYYLTSNYTSNKSFKYYYKTGQIFSLSPIDGWIENSNKVYAWIKSNIYIEDRRYTRDKKPLLYVPEGSVERRSKVICALANFSKGVVGIFHENEVWYMYPSYDDENNFVGYIYTKGRVGLGLPLGAEVETLYDGKTLCFPTYRGIVGMQYEQLTTNEEQVLTYLSDNIVDVYQDFYLRSGVGCKIFQYKFWIFFWQEGFKDCLMLDVRNMSWWPIEFSTPILNMARYKDKLYIRTEDGWGTPTEKGWYLDYDDKIINWHFQSQELHFDLINYRKRILSITLQSLETDEQKFSCILTCKNYRKRAFVSEEQVLEYPIDVVRTFVHRLNYLSSIEFQYKLSNDVSRAKTEQNPANLSAVTIKYEVGEAVR